MFSAHFGSAIRVSAVEYVPLEAPALLPHCRRCACRGLSRIGQEEARKLNARVALLEVGESPCARSCCWREGGMRTVSAHGSMSIPGGCDYQVWGRFNNIWFIIFFAHILSPWLSIEGAEWAICAVFLVRITVRGWLLSSKSSFAR